MAVTTDSDITGVTGSIITAATAVSVGTTPATTGQVRLPSLGTIAFRNVGDSANVLALSVDSNDDIVIGPGPGTEVMVTGDSGGKLGFYGTAPIAQQTGVAVTAGGIHAALVSLGLITA